MIGNGQQATPWLEEVRLLPKALQCLARSHCVLRVHDTESYDFHLSVGPESTWPYIVYLLRGSKVGCKTTTGWRHLAAHGLCRADEEGSFFPPLAPLPTASQAMQRNTKSVLLGKPANRAANACHGKAEESRIVTGDESAHVYVPSAVWRYISARYVARTGCVACGCVGECSGRLLHERGVPSQRLDRAVAVVRRMMCMSRKLVKALGIRGQRVIVVHRKLLLEQRS